MDASTWMAVMASWMPVTAPAISAMSTASVDGEIEPHNELGLEADTMAPDAPEADEDTGADNPDPQESSNRRLCDRISPLALRHTSRPREEE